MPIAQSLSEVVGGAVPTPSGDPILLQQVRLRAPITEDCRGMLCFGINYADHQRESADHFSAHLPSDPIVFFKTPSAIADPGADLLVDRDVSQQFDWEVELGVVIAKAGKNIAPAQVAEHIFGYTIVNDVTARDLQKRFSQWHIGKNVDRLTPVGPWLVSRDEVGFPPDLVLSLRIGDIEKQRAVTRDMIFDITTQICTLSKYIELLPGDIIATGTPSGVGFTRTPPEFLKPGDVAIAEISGIGRLVNPITGVGEDLRGRDLSVILNGEGVR